MAAFLFSYKNYPLDDDWSYLKAAETFHYTGDAVRGELRRSGKPVELTALEFKLLAAFVRNRGRLLSRQPLLDLVWGSDSFVTDRVVDNHVVALRKKIEPDPSRPRYLLSVRGMGYRFEA